MTASLDSSPFNNPNFPNDEGYSFGDEDDCYDVIHGFFEFELSEADEENNNLSTAIMDHLVERILTNAHNERFPIPARRKIHLPTFSILPSKNKIITIKQ